MIMMIMMMMKMMMMMSTDQVNSPKGHQSSKSASLDFLQPLIKEMNEQVCIYHYTYIMKGVYPSPSL